LAGVPIVINTVHGLYASPDDPIPRRAFFYTAEAVASRLSDHELVQSAEDVDLMKRLHIAPRSHLTHLGNGVDLEHFDPNAVSKEEVAALRTELGLAAGVPVVGVVGRLVAEKGFVELFEAIRKLWGRGYEFVLLVIGPADED
jgi:glycosyltransferase involved in cell wall biosynthesis